MADSLMRDFDVNAAAPGNLSAVYFYVYAAMQIPAGVLLDLHWTGELAASVRIYSPAAYDTAMLAMLIRVGIALALSFAIRESHPGRYPGGSMPL